MAKYSIDLETTECRVILNGLVSSLSVSQRAAKTARTDPVRRAFEQEVTEIQTVMAKVTKAFAV